MGHLNHAPTGRLLRRNRRGLTRHDETSGCSSPPGPRSRKQVAALWHGTCICRARRASVAVGGPLTDSEPALATVPDLRAALKPLLASFEIDAVRVRLTARSRAPASVRVQTAALGALGQGSGRRRWLTGAQCRPPTVESRGAKPTTPAPSVRQCHGPALYWMCGVRPAKHVVRQGLSHPTPHNSELNMTAGTTAAGLAFPPLRCGACARRTTSRDCSNHAPGGLDKRARVRNPDAGG